MRLPVGQRGVSAAGSYKLEGKLNTGPIRGMVEAETELSVPDQSPH